VPTLTGVRDYYFHNSDGRYRHRAVPAGAITLIVSGLLEVMSCFDRPYFVVLALGAAYSSFASSNSSFNTPMPAVRIESRSSRPTLSMTALPEHVLPPLNNITARPPTASELLATFRKMLSGLCPRARRPHRRSRRHLDTRTTAAAKPGFHGRVSIRGGVYLPFSSMRQGRTAKDAG